ncbi:MAG: response regulator [Anaerolineae bacterium]|nr:response regulator [Anaerolineae bacterium]
MNTTIPDLADFSPAGHILLVVDDNPANLAVVTDYLTEYGFKVLTAQNSEAGLERAQRMCPDMILLDVVMPGIDGFETCERLKANVATQDIPVIFMTALTEPEHKIKGFQLGAVDYIIKPIEKDELLARVLTHLRLRDLNRRLEQKVSARTAELERAHQQMRMIVETVPEGVLLLDTEERILSANPTASGILPALTGVCVGEVVTRLGDRSIEELLTSPPAGLWHEVLADGLVFQVNARPLETGAVPAGWVLVIRDITHQREFDRRIQQQERLAAIGQLAAGIAHDFNNILAVITLYAHMELRDSVPSSKLHERLRIIVDQAMRATTLIQQILDFSRRAVFERHPLDLLSFLKEQIKLLERTLPENIELSLTHPDEEIVIQADSTRLQQVIMNLAVNARDAMPQGGELRFELQSLQLEKGLPLPLAGMGYGAWILLTVTDSGSGIASDILPHIFEPFFTTKGSSGTGLGLAQVYGIVKQHDGDLNVVSKKGQGTTFNLYFPAARALQESEFLPPAVDLPQAHGETLLVVEDNPAMRAALVETLSGLNYHVLEAPNGNVALAMLENHAGEVALVLSDMVMPEMGGAALFHAMRQRGLRIPVIMLSGHPLENELQDLQSQGLAGWLLKPPDLAHLAQALRRILYENQVV